MLLLISRQIYMSKYFILSLLLLFLGVSCKTNQELTKEHNPNAELSKDQGQAEIQKLENVPVDLASLHKALGFSEAEKAKFFEIYKKHHKRIQLSRKSDVSDKEKFYKQSKIKRERDSEVLEMLNFDQKKIYKDYIKFLNKREIESGGSKSKNF